MKKSRETLRKKLDLDKINKIMHYTESSKSRNRKSKRKSSSKRGGKRA